MRSLRLVKNDQNEDIVFLGLVQDVDVKEMTEGKVVTVALELTRNYREWKKQIESTLGEVEGISAVRVYMGLDRTKVEKESTAERPHGLKGVSKIIAVASCKGGVGKSTTAVNLAFSLAKQDYRVGIFDADIHGPSLPTLLNSPDITIRRRSQDQTMIPVYYQGVKAMSFGWIKTGTAGSDPESGLAVMRGPILSQVVTQLLSFTDWGELDYLVIDMPPGTGDVQLSLSQQVKMDGAVVITTPQKLSFVDVVKGIQMFDKVSVPTVAVVENMSHFVCSCGKPSYPFGKGYKQQIIDQFGIKNSYSIPILESIALQADIGDPVVLNQDPETQMLRDLYDEIALNVVDEIKLIDKEGQKAPEITSEDDSIHFLFSDGYERVLPALFLRERCAQIEHRPAKDKDVRAENVERRGNYAANVRWTDGHSSLFSYENLRKYCAIFENEQKENGS